MLNVYYKTIRPHFKAKGINGVAVRYFHAMVRRLIPSVNERHRLELMVGPLGYWDLIQKYQMNFLMQMGLEPSHRLLDIGCGPLSGGLAFIRYLDPGNYTGIDIHQESVDEANRQITKAGLDNKKPCIVCSDSFGDNELNGNTFDFAWASQIMYHLSSEKIDTLFGVLARVLRKNGKLYCDIIGYPNRVRKESHWNGFTFHLHTFDDLRKLAENHGFHMKHIGQIGQYGYPPEIMLRTNDMLEFSKQ